MSLAAHKNGYERPVVASNFSSRAVLGANGTKQFLRARHGHVIYTTVCRLLLCAVLNVGLRARVCQLLMRVHFAHFNLAPAVCVVGYVIACAHTLCEGSAPARWLPRSVSTQLVVIIVFFI